MRPRLVILVLAWVASGLPSACRHVPPVALLPEETANRQLGKSLDDPSLRTFLEEQTEPHAVWPQQRWSLRDLTFAALYLRSDLKVAQAAAGIAGAHVEAASARPNPTLSFLPQRVTNPASGVSPWLATVSLDWPVETAGKREHRRAAARARAEAALFSERSAAWQVRGDVYQAVVALRAAQERRNVFARAASLRDREIALLERRREVGEISEIAVAPEQRARLQARADLAVSERQLAEAFAQLATAVGAPVRAVAAIDVDYPFDPPRLRDPAPGCVGARRAALLGRSDVLALLSEYAAAEEDLRLELAKQYPDLHLGPVYEFDQGADKWGLALSLELPILDQNGGAIDEAVARRSEVAARFDALQAQVIGEVDSACTALAGSIREEEQTRALRGQAAQRLVLAEQSFGQGALDRVGLTTAELELQTAAAIWIDSAERLHRARAGLERVTEQSRDLPAGSLPGAGEGAGGGAG